ncbi:hypothetical protein J2Z76_003219 [Sedimentibacter acidaminivorans]|jgi:hypothetical protein|uniref:DNA primase n=1 Tax=Sedimentibacter acidaminivorans TaxID=913099 RepID=A0ABS4GI01_9FIRM|nr:CD1247 N-terminal domain-containing protein [Sedimentibacter acidaminivorans]MBP1927322.1 hypothetical protein [Sedimentibacter acidaminivorans]
MDFLYEKISYLKGLADGLDVKSDTKEGKLFNAMLEVIEEIADGMSDIVEEQEEMNEYLDLLDEDLTTIEEELFDDIEIDEDEDYDFDDDDYYDDDYYDDDFVENCDCCETLPEED